MLLLPIDAAPAELPTAPFVMPEGHSSVALLTKQAFEIAGRAAEADIQSEAHSVTLDGRTWWDVRPMLDRREHPAEVVDQSVEAIQFVIGCGLVGLHPQRPYLLAFERQA